MFTIIRPNLIEFTYSFKKGDLTFYKFKSKANVININVRKKKNSTRYIIFIFSINLIDVLNNTHYFIKISQEHFKFYFKNLIFLENTSLSYIF